MGALPIRSSEGNVEMQLQQVEIDAGPKTTPFERAFNPYDFNGGYVLILSNFIHWSLPTTQIFLNASAILLLIERLWQLLEMITR
jgi:hypothetical protein